MKNRLKIIFFLFLVTPVSIVMAQTLEQLERLEDLESLSQNLSDSDTTSTDGSTGSEENDRLEQPIGVMDQELDENESVTFGFSGRGNFLVSPVSKKINKPLEHFGYDYFNNNANSYALASDITIPTNYILGPGDEIKIILFGNKNKKYTLRVTREGEIFIPEIGPVSVAGLTFSDLKETIGKIIESQFIGTRVSLTLGDLRSINIFVLGEAVQPGMYTVSALSTLTNAIFLSGGIETTGSLRTIQLKRNGKNISDFDFYQLLLKGDTSHDKKLMAGDVVFIPPITKKVAVIGEVERPGIYELVDGEVAEDLINFAGTLKTTADLSSIELQRVDSMGGGFKLLDINIKGSPLSKLDIEDGDTLSIYPLVDKLNKAIFLSGHTQKPGYYAWKDGMRILDVIGSKEDLLPLTDMNYLLIKRENSISGRYEALQVNLEGVFNNPNSDLNITLQEKDELIFFPSTLSTDLIEVSVLKDGYVDIDDQLRPIYMQKAMQENQKQEEQEARGFGTELNVDNNFQEEYKFFSYSVHNYCIFNQQQAFSFSGEKLPETTTVNSLLNIPTNIAKNKLLTSFCRRQLIDPVVELLVDQSSPTEAEQIVSIFGNVSFPGKYPLTKSAKLQNIIFAAGGLNSLSFLDEVEIASKNISQKEIVDSNRTYSYQTAKEISLKPLDNITIKSVTNSNNTVSIAGEVFFPGIYPIAKNETITDLFERVGGFTKDASLDNAFFSRQSLVNQQQQRLQQAREDLRKQILLASQNSPSNSEGDEYFNRLLILTEEDTNQLVLGRLVANFPDIINGSAEDIVLKNGDQIIIPPNQQVITVVGEVYASNSHLFNENIDIDQYILMSGGTTKFADVDAIYVIKADGSVNPLGSKSGFFKTRSGALSPGDTIVVPIMIRSFSGLKATADITQIIYQMALSAAAVNSF